MLIRKIVHTLIFKNARTNFDGALILRLGIWGFLGKILSGFKFWRERKSRGKSENQPRL
jgi:hypothetical protein